MTRSITTNSPLLALCPWLALALLLLASPAAAENDDHPPGWYCPLGVNLGLSYDGSDTGALLGGELSAAYLEGTWWYGLLADAVYDFRDDALWTGVGLELGWFALGTDVSAILDATSDEWRWGTRVRGLLTAGLFTLHAGWVHLLQDMVQDRFEMGLLLKWPFEL